MNLYDVLMAPQALARNQARAHRPAGGDDARRRGGRSPIRPDADPPVVAKPRATAMSRSWSNRKAGAGPDPQALLEDIAEACRKSTDKFGLVNASSAATRALSAGRPAGADDVDPPCAGQAKRSADDVNMLACTALDLVAVLETVRGRVRSPHDRCDPAAADNAHDGRGGDRACPCPKRAGCGARNEWGGATYATNTACQGRRGARGRGDQGLNDRRGSNTALGPSGRLMRIDMPTAFLLYWSDERYQGWPCGRTCRLHRQVRRR
jgi:hypothetical protein